MSAVVCCTQHLRKVLIVHRGRSGCGFGGSQRPLPLYHGGWAVPLTAISATPAAMSDNRNFRGTTPIVDNPHPRPLVLYGYWRRSLPHGRQRFAGRHQPGAGLGSLGRGGGRAPGTGRDEALTVGRALSGLTAHAKGVRLGIFEPSPEHAAQHRQSLKHGDRTEIRLMGRNVEAITRPKGCGR